MVTPDSWFNGGERVRVELSGSSFEVFCRTSGSGPWLTLLHGFPTSSWDWAKVAPTLERRFRLLCFDLLGFGDSEKPRRHRYTIFEQADLAEQLWRRFRIAETGLVGHDYGSTVAQELLARATARTLSAQLTSVVLLNAAVYAHLARPLLVQRLLATPLIGHLVARTTSGRLFARSLSSVFSERHPITSEELAAHWLILQRRGGTRPILPGIASYMRERRVNATRWESALEGCDRPLSFVWGMADPRSGAHVADHVRARVPGARFTALEGVGHYPQLEVPDLVGAEIVAAFGASA